MFSFISALADAWYWKQMRLVSLRVMTVLSSAVYKKSLLLSALGRQQYTAGEVVNLIAVDCSKVNTLEQVYSKKPTPQAYLPFKAMLRGHSERIIFINILLFFQNFLVLKSL